MSTPLAPHDQKPQLAGEDAAAPRSPNDAELAAFARDGYLSWGRILGSDEIAGLRREYDRVFAEAHADACRNLSHASGAGDRAAAGERQMFQILQVCERSLLFRRLLHDERILAVVRALIGPNIVLFHDQALFKPPRTGGAVSWHQDNGYWRCRPATLISCWLTLDDADAANGAMQVVPGSHLAPETHAQDGGSDALLAAPDPHPSTVRVIDLPAGGCMFHHCQTLHYTAPNDTDRQRRAFIIHCMPPGTIDRDGNTMSAGWSRPVLGLRM